MSKLFSIVEYREARAVRHLVLQAPSRARGLVEQVYAQVRSDYLLAAPLILHSLQPQLLQGFWGIFRETLLAGSLPRSAKEVIAVEIARLNQCPYCEEAHSLSLEALDGLSSGDPDPRRREIELWCRATRSPGSALLREPPFAADELPEALGLLLVFHYLNRMVSAFCPERVVQLPPVLSGLRSPLRAAVRIFMKSRVTRVVEPGRPTGKGGLPTELAWAEARPSVASALLYWLGALDEVAESLSPSVRAIVEGELERWQGEELPLISSWPENLVSHLDTPDRNLASFALRMARCPYRISDEELIVLRDQGLDDPALLALAAWSASRAAFRIVGWSRPE